MYLVKEIYYTIQGEGYHVGRPAVFLRFSGCNLWSGHEKDRKNAICKFCDTDFIGTNGDGGGKFECPKKNSKNRPPFHSFRDPKNHQKSTRAELLGVSDGVLKTDPRPRMQKVRFCHYLLYLS